MKLCREVETQFGSFRFARYIKNSGRIFTIYASKNGAVFREVCHWKQLHLFPVANFTVCRVKLATGIIVS